MNHLLHLFVIVILALIIISSCKAKSSPTIKPTSSDNGSKFVKEDGCDIPGLSVSQKKGTSVWSANAGNGESVSINVTDYDPLPADVLTEEPFKSTGSGLGLIRIYAIKEFSVGTHVFCYKVQANRAGVDEKTGAHSYSSVLFFFAYYDEDGDGKFESLVLDEKDQQGTSNFHVAPHIPRWTLKS